MAKNVLDERMLEVMERPEIKEAGLKVTLTLKDGSKRVGIYTDIVVNPQKRFEFNDVKFIQLRVDRPEKGMMVSMPIIHVDTVEWSQ